MQIRQHWKQNTNFKLSDNCVLLPNLGGTEHVNNHYQSKIKIGTLT